jgi:enterochelin esterase-like enzyme
VTAVTATAATGVERYVHVYLPSDFDGTTQWPIWVHLHGVFWATMGDIGQRVSVLATGVAVAVYGVRVSVLLQQQQQQHQQQ